MSLVKIKHLTKYYTREEPVISNLNLEFPSRGLNIVVGKSGCGKTTLLNVIGSMDNNYIGTVRVNGKVLSKMTNEQLSKYKNFTIGYIFQKDDLFEELTVEENLDIVLNMQSKKASISEVLEKVGLAGFEKRKIKYLSGGERQRVSIARVLIKDCAIILADEPTSALDSKNGNQIFKILHDISKEKLVIAVTHDTKKAFQYADRIIRFSDGNVVEDKIITENSDPETEDISRRAKGTALMPVFKFQFTRGLFINIFVTILLSLAMIVLAVSAEQKIVYDEYQKYEQEGYSGVNIDRVIKTQIANDINYWNVGKINDEKSPYQYLSEVGNVEENLNASDIENLKQRFNHISLSTHNKDIGELILKYVSEETIEETTDHGGGVWKEPHRTEIVYYLYDANNKYDIIGELPKADNEILVTDTVADLYMRKRSDDGTLVLVDGEYVPSQYYKTFDGDYTKIIGDTLIVRDIYYQSNSYHLTTTYYYTTDIEYKVTGIIKTGQLDFYYYFEGDYYFTSKVKQQTGRAKFMNSASNQPFGYIVTMKDLDGIRENPYLFNPMSLETVYCDDTELLKSIKTFRGEDDYRFLKYEDLYERTFVDNLSIDKQHRIIVKSVDDDYLKDNEIMLTLDTLKKIAPEVDINSNSSIINYFNNNLKDQELLISFGHANGVADINCKVVGITKDASNLSLYVSDDIFRQLYKAGLDEITYGAMFDLSGLNLEKRKILMEELFDLGYILSPVDMMPGAYSEFIPEASIANITDSIGETEEGNISLYNMYSEYYNTDSVKSMNNFLKILSSISIFTLVTALIVSIGCIYLNERKHRVHIVKLCILGVRPGKIILMQFITYVLMAVIAFGLTILGTWLFSIFINNAMTLHILMINAKGVEEGIFDVYRIRMLITSNTFEYAALGAVIVAMIGLICTSIAVKQFKK